MFSRAPGIMLVVIVTAIIFLFLLYRVLDRMRMGKGVALLLVALMYLGGFLPSIPLINGLAVNLGGMVIPLGICVYLIAKASTPLEKIRGPISAVLAAVVVWSLDRFLPVNPGSVGYELDPLYLPAVAAGVIAYLAGRSRRSSFIGGVVGVLLLDISSWAENMLRGFHNIPILLGGAGVFDAAVIAGVFAVMLAELVGEIRERVASEN